MRKPYEITLAKANDPINYVGYEYDQNGSSPYPIRAVGIKAKYGPTPTAEQKREYYMQAREQFAKTGPKFGPPIPRPLPLPSLMDSAGRESGSINPIIPIALATGIIGLLVYAKYH